MQLTRFTDIGLRVLMYAAFHQRDSLITIHELSTQYDLSHNHVIKVVNRLVKLGWLSSTRGRHGGLRLSISPKDLTIGQVVRELEGSESLLDCDKANCNLTGHCILQGVLRQGMEELYQWLNQFTLADMAKNPTASMLIDMHDTWHKEHT